MCSLIFEGTPSFLEENFPGILRSEEYSDQALRGPICIYVCMTDTCDTVCSGLERMRLQHIWAVLPWAACRRVCTLSEVCKCIYYVQQILTAYSAYSVSVLAILQQIMLMQNSSSWRWRCVGCTYTLCCDTLQFRTLHRHTLQRTVHSYARIPAHQHIKMHASLHVHKDSPHIYTRMHACMHACNRHKSNMHI